MGRERPSNEDASRISGEERGGTPWGKIGLLVLGLLLVIFVISFACQELGGGGGDQGSGAEETTETGEAASEDATGNGAADDEAGSGIAGGGAAGEGDETTGASGTEETDSGETADESAGQVSAQFSESGEVVGGDGNSVTVPQAELSGAAGWLAIHGDDNGEPGDVLGYAPLEEGANTDIEVDLDQAVQSQTLYAMVHADDPADGEFTFPDGDPAVEQDGAPVTQSLQYTVSGEPEILPDSGGPALSPTIGAAFVVTLGTLLSLYLYGRGSTSE